jgi:uncharacterized membrane protein YfcA
VSRRLAAVAVSAGLLSGLLGVGGGLIIVPGLVWAAGLGRHTASGTSLVAILPIAGAALLTYALAPGGAFDLAASAILVAGSMTGAVIGARANLRLSERGLRLALAVISGVFGLRLVIPFGFGEGAEEIALGAGTVVLLLALGLNGGFLAGLLGVGGSAIAIAMMVIVLGINQVLAQGIGLAATIPTVIVAAVAHWRQGSVDPALGLRVGVLGMLVAVPGAFLAFALPVELLRTAFGVLLLAGSARTLFSIRTEPRRRARAGHASTRGRDDGR